jgi:hypothetical protein
MPLSYASWMFLLIRFSRDSLANFKRHNKNGSTASTNSKSGRSSASVTPQHELYTVTVNTCHDDDDDIGDETAAARNGETKGEAKSTELVQQPRGRRQSISISLATDYSIVSIAAVSNIVNMILAPMVIVPFLDYITLGKIPRSNTAKPGTSDGAFAKMGTLKSISQPLTNGWTVIFVSVSSGASLRSLPRTSLHPTGVDSANDAPIIIISLLPMI